jgi:hypothetical protein
MSVRSDHEATLIKPSILEASPEEREAWQERFGELVEAFGSGPAAEMTETELDALVREEFAAQRAEDRSWAERYAARPSAHHAGVLAPTATG